MRGERFSDVIWVGRGIIRATPTTGTALLLPYIAGQRNLRTPSNSKEWKNKEGTSKVTLQKSTWKGRDGFSHHSKIQSAITYQNKFQGNYKPCPMQNPDAYNPFTKLFILVLYIHHFLAGNIIEN